MKRGLLALLAMCAVATAWVPRDRRAVNTEEELEAGKVQNVTPLCARQTPCAWSVYKTSHKIVEIVVNNTYCVCTPDLTCKADEDDTTASAFVHHCRPDTDVIDKLTES